MVPTSHLGVCSRLTFFDKSSQRGAAKPGGLLSQDLGRRIFGRIQSSVKNVHAASMWLRFSQSPVIRSSTNQARPLAQEAVKNAN